MKKNFKLGSFLLTFFVVFAFLFSYTNVIRANETIVSNMEELKNAIARGESISLTSSFDITEEIVISNNYNGTIKGNNNTLSLVHTNEENAFENMFVSNGANVTFDSVTLDGKEKGRLLKVNGGNVVFSNSKLTNGTTDKYQQKIVGNNDNQEYQGGALLVESGATVNLRDTTFESNYTKTEVLLSSGKYASPSGGAIYVGGRSTVNITGGAFVNNKTGGVAGGVGSNGEGGAIKIEGGSTLNINNEVDTQKDKTIFEGNSNDKSDDQGGRQGGSIEATDATVNIYATTFKISGPFNTGGAIKFEGSKGKIKNSEFTIKENLGAIGISAGAINSQDSNLVIEDSIFNTGIGTYMAESGGLIGIFGGGTFELKNSTLNGSGTGWNSNGKYKTTKYGGAIIFYDGSTVVANIENSTIQNFTADISGSAIAITTQMDINKTSAVKLNIKNTNILNNATYTGSNTNYGGGLYIGKGKDEGENNNIVVIEGGRISSGTATATAGAIYNEGHLTITGGAQIRDNYAYWAVPGILNDGYLKIDDAYVGNNRLGDWYRGDNHILAQAGKPEYTGINIYAKKDVVITPNARFDGNDIRVIDGQSAVLLTGTLTNKVPVSISENEKNTTAGNLSRKVVESAHRYVGYTVAKGTEGYTPVPSDAQFIHYVTKDKSQASSDYNDHNSLAKWDYVFNPEENSVVLGQRAKLVYHTNEENATIEGGVADDAPAGQKLEQIYTFYMSKAGENPKVAINNKVEKELTVTDKIPTLAEYTFKSWNTDRVKDKAKYDVHNIEDEYDFDVNGTFSGTWLSPRTSEITSILSADTENALHTYAIYDKMLVFKAKKVWNAENKAEVTLQLIRTDKPEGEKVVEEKVVSADNTDWVVFKGVPKTENGVDISSKYVVIEKGITADRKLILNGKKYDVSITNTNEVPNPENNTKYFVIKNTELIDINVKKQWFNENNEDVTANHKENVEVGLYVGDQKQGDNLTLTLDGGYSATFENLPKLNDDGSAIDYKVKEKGVNTDGVVRIKDKDYNVVVEGDKDTGFIIKNTLKEPEKVTIEGTKTWEDNNDQDGKRPQSITIQLKNGETVVETKVVTPNEDGEWKWSFTDKPKYENDGKTVINYTIDEVEVAGYIKAIDGYNVTNTHTPETITVAGSKTWVDNNNQDKKRPESITINLMKGNEKLQSKEVREVNGNWTWSFENLPKYENGNVINYTITEDEVKYYSTEVRGYNVINSYTPETIIVAGSKTWEDNNDKEGKRPKSITIQLKKGNEVVYTKNVTPNEVGNWTWSFENLPKYENGQEIVYSIDEEKVEGYTKVINGYNVTNTRIPLKPLTPATKSVKVTKVWSDETHRSELTVKLIKNGQETDQTILLNKENNWTATFENLPVVDNVTDKKATVYTVKEVGEKDGFIKLGEDKFKVVITEEPKNNFIITNTYVPKVPNNQTPDNPIPNNPSSDNNIENNEESKQNNKILPNTGISSETNIYGGIILLITGLGLFLSNKRRNEE